MKNWLLSKKQQISMVGFLLDEQQTDKSILAEEMGHLLAQLTCS